MPIVSKPLHFQEYDQPAIEAELHNQEGDGAVGFDSPGAVQLAAVPNGVVEVLGALPRECDPIPLEVALVVSSSMKLLTQRIQSRLLKGREGFG